MSSNEIALIVIGSLAVAAGVLALIFSEPVHRAMRESVGSTRANRWVHRPAARAIVLLVGGCAIVLGACMVWVVVSGSAA